MAKSDELTKTQVDRLGDRLRKGDFNQDDVRLLDVYRRSFNAAYEDVVGKIREQLKLEPTGRPAKSTTSISDKLRRETIRLSQIQDISGCRIVVATQRDQDQLVEHLKLLFDKNIVVDRRQHPSHGYRFIHVIVNSYRKPIEIQIRTSLQHLWAELSEKLSDVLDNAIKYGGGDAEVHSLLVRMSENIMALETSEGKLLQALASVEGRALSDDVNSYIIRAREGINLQRQRITALLEEIGEIILREKGRNDALSN